MVLRNVCFCFAFLQGSAQLYTRHVILACGIVMNKDFRHNHFIESLTAAL